jgi:hypothetical protein
MAKEYYGINRGETEFKVVVAGADPTKAVTLVIDLSKNMTKNEVLMAIECIENNIVKGKWPPA